MPNNNSQIDKTRQDRLNAFIAKKKQQSLDTTDISHESEKETTTTQQVKPSRQDRLNAFIAKKKGQNIAEPPTTSQEQEIAADSTTLQPTATDTIVLRGEPVVGVSIDNTAQQEVEDKTPQDKADEESAQKPYNIPTFRTPIEERPQTDSFMAGIDARVDVVADDLARRYKDEEAARREEADKKPLWYRAFVGAGNADEGMRMSNAVEEGARRRQATGADRIIKEVMTFDDQQKADLDATITEQINEDKDYQIARAEYEEDVRTLLGDKQQLSDSESAEIMQSLTPEQKKQAEEEVARVQAEIERLTNTFNLASQEVAKRVSGRVNNDIINRIIDRLATRNMPQSDLEYIGKAIHNNSVIGMLYETAVKAASGGSWIDYAVSAKGLEKYDASTAAKIAGGVGALLVDSGIFSIASLGGAAAAGAINSLATRIVATRIAQGSATTLAKGALKETAKRIATSKAINRLASNIISQSVTLGSYDAASSILQQNLSNPDGIDWVEVLKRAGSGAASGAAIGVIGAGMQAIKGMPRVDALKAKGLPVDFTLGTVGLLAENAAFVGVGSLVSGEEADWQSFAEGLATLGILKGVGALKAGLHNPFDSRVRSFAERTLSDLRFTAEEEAAFRKAGIDADGLGIIRSTLEHIESVEPASSERKALSLAYNEAMASKDVPLSAKVKLQYIVTGRVQNVPDVLEMKIVEPTEYGEPFVVNSYDRNGRLLSISEFADGGQARAYINKYKPLIERNTIAQYENMVNGVSRIVALDRSVRTYAERENVDAQSVFNDALVYLGIVKGEPLSDERKVRAEEVISTARNASRNYLRDIIRRVAVRNEASSQEVWQALNVKPYLRTGKETRLVEDYVREIKDFVGRPIDIRPPQPDATKRISEESSVKPEAQPAPPQGPTTPPQNPSTPPRPSINEAMRARVTEAALSLSKLNSDEIVSVNIQSSPFGSGTAVVREGYVVMDEDGDIDRSLSDSTVVVEFEDGHRATVSIDDIAEVTYQGDVTDMVRRAEARQEQTAQMLDLINTSVDNGQSVAAKLADGTEGVISGVDEYENYIFTTKDEQGNDVSIPLSGTEIVSATPIEATQTEQPQSKEPSEDVGASKQAQEPEYDEDFPPLTEADFAPTIDFDTIKWVELSPKDWTDTMRMYGTQTDEAPDAFVVRSARSYYLNSKNRIAGVDKQIAAKDKEIEKLRAGLGRAINPQDTIKQSKRIQKVQSERDAIVASKDAIVKEMAQYEYALREYGIDINAEESLLRERDSLQRERAELVEADAELERTNDKLASQELKTIVNTEQNRNRIYNLYVERGVTPEQAGLRQAVLWDIATGNVHLRWEDGQNANGTKVKGLASELGLGGSAADKRAYKSIVAKNGDSIDAYVHSLWEQRGGYTADLDDIDMKNEVLDVLQSAPNGSRALEQLYDMLGISADREEGFGQSKADIEKRISDVDARIATNQRAIADFNKGVNDIIGRLERGEVVAQNGGEQESGTERTYGEASVESGEQLSEEVDENGSPFVLSSTGSTVFGEISVETGLTPAPIKLSRGNSRYGLIHLENRHGEEIRKAGFNSVKEFVEYVCKNYNRIRQGVNSSGEPNGTYLLQSEGIHNDTLYIKLSKNRNYWDINSGGSFRDDYGDDKKEVWSASEVQNEQSAADSTLRDDDKSDNQTTPNGDVPTTSNGKDNALSSEKQKTAEKVEDGGEDVRNLFDTVQERVDEETGNVALFHREEKQPYQEITYDNFYLGTVGTFDETQRPDRKPDYVSYSKDNPNKVSSMYWYGEDADGKYVIRGSDHWSYNGEGGNIASCYWYFRPADAKDYIQGAYSLPRGRFAYGDIAYGKAYLNDMRFRAKHLNATPPAGIDAGRWNAIVDMVKDGVGAENVITDPVQVKAEYDRIVAGQQRVRERIVEDANSKYNEQLRQFANGTMRSGDKIQFGTPSAILLACGIGNVKMSTTQRILKDHIDKHILAIDDIKDLPQALENPLMVYRWGTKAKSFVIITEIPRNDERIAVAVRFREEGNGLRINHIASVHGKSVEHLIDEMATTKSDFAKDNLKYVDKERTLQWLATGDSFGPSVSTEKFDSATKIIKDFENPKVEAENLRQCIVYHGSAADFEAFDHSHMGEGEGAQAYGWGTYVTEVKGIAMSYAKAASRKPVDKENNIHTIEKRRREAYNNADGERICLSFNIEKLKTLEERLVKFRENGLETMTDDLKIRIIELRERIRIQKAEIDRLDFEAEQLDQKSLPYRWAYDDWLSAGGARLEDAEDYLYNNRMALLNSKKGSDEESKARERVRKYEAEVRELKAKLQGSAAEQRLIELNLDVSRHPLKQLYTVDIPNDNGENYLKWNARIKASQAKRILDWIENSPYKKAFNHEKRVCKQVGEKFKPIEDRTGREVYEFLRYIMYDVHENRTIAPKLASQALSDMGFVGMSYPAQYRSGGRSDGARNYVIFDEKNAQIIDHERYFRTPNGEVYGFTIGNRIYLDSSKMNPETPIHEYTELWSKVVADNQPELWARGKELLKETKTWKEVNTDKNYKNLSEDERASETLSRITAKIAAKKMSEIADDRTLVAKLRAWLRKFWKGLKGTFEKWTDKDLAKIKVEDFIMMPLRDLIDKVDLTKYTKAKAERANEARLAQNRAELDAIQAERDAIITKAKADGTYMKAPNGKPTRLTEREWADVRTPRFKQWFGDWEKAAQSVKVVSAVADHGFKSFGEAKVWARNNVVRTLANEETGGKGVIRISNTAVNKYLSESAVAKSDSKDVHLSVLKVLPDVIRNSVDVEQHADYNKGSDGTRSAENAINPDTLIHRLYGAVKIDGNVYRVKITLKEDTRNQSVAKKAYSYEATKIELLTGTLGKPKGDTPSANNSISVAKILNNVEKSHGNGEKVLDFSQVVDENGEPLAVYHGTSKRWYGGKFNTFDTDNHPVWFTPDRSYAEEYSTAEGRKQHRLDRPQVYSTFLNMRNVKDVGRIDYGGTNALVEFAQQTGIPLEDIKAINAERYREAFGEEVSNPNDIRMVYDLTNSRQFKDYLSQKGYDGMRALEGKNTTFAAFYPNQVKSATDNIGTYDTRENDIRFMFAGEKGAEAADRAQEATARMDNLAVARDMEQSGKDAAKIKLATGWERGADGKWRYEIPDAKIKDTLEMEGKSFKRDESDMLWTSGKLGNVVEAPDLFEAYPQLKDVRLDTDEILNDGYSNGYYDPKRNMIVIHADKLKYLNGILNHEIQHAIQRIEGFARGGNPDMLQERNAERVNELQRLRSEIEHEVAEGNTDREEQLAEIDLELGDYDPEIGGYDYYRHLSGEVEARNVERRMKMTPEERRTSLASATEDVAREDQIFLYDNLDVAGRDARISESAETDGTTEGGEAANQSRVDELVARLASLQAQARNRNQDVRALTAEVIKFVKDKTNDVVLKNLGEQRFRSIMNGVQAALAKITATRATSEWQMAEIRKALDKIDTRITEALIKDNREAIEKLLNLRVYKFNPMGVKMGNRISENTRQIFDQVQAGITLKSKKWSDEENRYVYYYTLTEKAADTSETLADIEREMYELPPEDNSVMHKIAAVQILKRYNDAIVIYDAIDEIEKKINTKTAERSAAFRAKQEALEANNLDTHAEELVKWRNLKGEIAGLQADLLNRKHLYNDALATFRQGLETLIEGGRNAWIDAVHKEAEQRANLMRIAFSSIRVPSAIPYKKTEIGDEVVEIKENRNNELKALVSNWLPAVATFDSVLRAICINDIGNRYGLYDEIMGGEEGLVFASDNEYKNKQKMFSAVEEQIKAFHLGKNMNDLIAITKKPSGMYITNKGNKGNIELTIGELMYIYASSRQEQGRKMLINANIEDMHIDAMADHLVEVYPNEWRFVNWVTDEFLPTQRYERYNGLYEDLYKTQMPDTPHYFPLVVNKEQLYKAEEIGEGDVSVLPTSTVGSIIARREHNYGLNLDTNFVGQLISHINDMEHWYAFAKPIKQINTLLSSTQFRNVVEAQAKGAVSLLKEVANIAVGGRTNSGAGVFSKTLKVITRNDIASNITFRFNTALKQTLSYPVYFSYSASPRYWLCLARAFNPKNIPANWKWAINELPTVKERWESRSAGFDQLNANDFSVMYGRIVGKVVSAGMLANSAIDLLTCAVGARAIYEFEYDNNIKAGMTAAAAEVDAKYRAALFLNQTQQSGNNIFLSRMQKKVGLASQFMAYRNANLGYARLETHAIAEAKRAVDKDTKRRRIAARTAYYKRAGMNNKQAEHKAKHDHWQNFLASLLKLGILGGVAPLLWADGSKGLLGYRPDTDDDDEESGISFIPYLSDYPFYGPAISDVISNASNPNFRFSNLKLISLPTLETFSRNAGLIYDRLSSDGKKADRYDATVAFSVATLAMRYGIALDPKTFENMYHGVKGMARDGMDYEDIMEIFNVPRSSVKAIVGRIREGETKEEYMQRLSFANRRIRSRSNKVADKKIEDQYFEALNNKFYKEMGISPSEVDKFEKKANKAKNRLHLTAAGYVEEDYLDDYEKMPAEQAALVDSLGNRIYDLQWYDYGLKTAIEPDSIYKADLKSRYEVLKQLNVEYDKYMKKYGN